MAFEHGGHCPMSKRFQLDNVQHCPMPLSPINFSIFKHLSYIKETMQKNILSMSLLIQIYMFPMNLEMAAEYNDYNKYKINEGTWALDTT
ncbi:139_t:CDS:2 [Entrophospora sp. SA101]|nr:139_t:CDS:2 [Entrophospora sp. SA101]